MQLDEVFREKDILVIENKQYAMEYNDLTRKSCKYPCVPPE